MQDESCGGEFGVGGPNLNAVYQFVYSPSEYIGCYVDSNDTVVDFTDGPSAVSRMDRGYTRISCTHACAGFAYFALSNVLSEEFGTGAECYCSNEPPQFELRPDSECGSDNLGRFERNSVSRIADTPSTYQGCFIEATSPSPRHHTLGPSGQSEDNRGWSRATCAMACRQFGQTFFNLQDPSAEVGPLCFCGSLTVVGRLRTGSDDPCDVENIGEGGFLRLALYTIGEAVNPNATTVDPLAAQTTPQVLPSTTIPATTAITPTDSPVGSADESSVPAVSSTLGAACCVLTVFLAWA